jgi:glycosyltransferase involved in cell wall biosynthesis
MPAPVLISVVIITFNEERNIARCLDSVSTIADEVVVVDSFSTDATQEICVRKKVKFIEHNFEGHIGQKNFAIEQATHDCILSLDADEALSEELRQSVLEVKQNWQLDAYEMNRLTNYCGKWIRHTDWYPDRKTRLFDRRKAHWGGLNPHDRIIVATNARLGHLKGDILHYSYHSISQHIGQLNYFTDIGARIAFENHKKSGNAKILFSPVVKFIKSYIIRRGFLDGYYGFIVCAISAFASFLKYVKLKELNRKHE